MRIAVCSVLLLCGGCLTSDGLSTVAQSETNMTNLTRICLGMEEAEVVQIMHCPHSEETYTVDGTQYDVWFYVTSPTILGQTRMVHANLTPLTFKNDCLISTDWAYYKWVKQQSCKKPEAAPAAPVAPPEDKNLEKTLNEPTAPTTAAPENKEIENALNQPAPPPPAPPAESQDLEKALNPPPPPPSAKPVKVKCPACPGVLEANNEDVEIDEEDEKMLQQEQEQDFNFW